MTTFRKPSRLNRILAASLAVFVGLGPVATPTYAALTALADEPINVKNSSKPNIVMTIDDSTSMFYDFLPDYVVGTVTYVKVDPTCTVNCAFTKTVTDAFCRGANGAMGTACGYNDFPTNSGDGGQYVSPQYIWEQPSYPYPKYDNGSNADIKAPFVAPFTFGTSGPGAGCNTDSTPPSCSGGIDPGPLPGITNYPLTPGAAGASPLAGQPYQYWLLWPAPAHNAALNHLYYNPLLTYETPARPDGSAYPQMDSSYTSGWTKVPPNPFADPDNVLSCLTDGTCVDLTAKVIVGQWCNSDWTQGNDDSGTPFVTNPGFCRANGLVAAASDGAPAADGDYSYPWAPPGITPNDVLSKVDWSTVSIATTPPTNATILPAWATAQDAKNFYENDNVLWCDISSPDWPQSGPTLPQTCTGFAAQSCDANSVPVCSGGVGGTCNGYIAAGTCNNQTKGTCNGGAGSGKCNGVTGVCTGYVAGACGGGLTGSCSNKPTCTGFTAKSCSALTREACTGATGACGAAPAQTCNGGTHSACSPTGTTFTCNGYQGPQTCDNHTPAPTCANQWDPPGCNTDPNPEGSCVYHSVCNTPTPVYTCSIKGNSCLAANGTSGDASKCPIVYGSCSGGTNNGGTCSSNANCPGTTNKCVANGAACSTSNDCPFNANSGSCSITSAACTPGGAACPAGPKTCTAGKPNSTTCTTAADCNVSGHCAVTTGTSCTSSANCPTVPLSGACNYQNNSGVANGACTSAADCKDKPNVCNNPAGLACSTVATCTQGTCNTQNSSGGSACAVNTDCINTGNHCTAGLGTGVACTTAAQCNKLGTCSAGSSPTGTCTTAANCNVAGTCTTGNVGAACSSSSSSDVACKKAGTCANGAAGPCYTNGANDVACAKPGVCSNTGVACTGAAGQCGAQTGTCTTGKTGSCTTGADCDVANICSSSSNNGSTCSTAADCTATRACSVDHLACTGGGSGTCVPIGHCSIDTGISCTGSVTNNPSCVNKPGPLNPSLARCDTSGVSGNSLTTLLADANGAGKTCRRNNHLYASDGVSAGRFNYPSGKFTTPVSGENVAGLGCHKTDQYTSIPRHYWKTSVEWCDKNINTAGDKWLGYGTPTGGSCQAFKDAAHSYPRFYQFGAAPGTDNVSTPAFARVDLVDTGAANEFQHSYTDEAGDAQTLTRTYAEEMTNYANWFAYYRTRIQAIKTVTSLSFLGKDPTTSKFNVDDKFRVGLHTLSNNPKTTFVPVDDFNATQKTAWATQLFGLNIRMAQETPNLNAMVRIGEYFKNGGSADLTASADPIVLSCQKNWHMLFTDGLTNQPAIPGVTVNDTDDTVPDAGSAPWIVGILTPGAAWPAPYREDITSPSSNSAADYSTYYWVTDLRPDMTNNVGTSAADKANWQHVNFAAISLGTQGKLAAGDQSGIESQLAAGTLQWTVPSPTVNKPDASGVDDLWHASINSRGRFVNADSADEIKIGMGAILADIANTAGSRAGAGLQTVNITGAGAYAYRVTFEPGWGGTLSKVKVDTSTLQEIPPAPWQVGGGKDVTAPVDSLYAQLTPTVAKPEPWYTARNIVTMHTDGTAIPFLFDDLSAAQQDALAPGKPTRGLQVLEYLRGSAQNEGSATLNFRKRTSPLGDIVDASPKYVGPPNLPYQEFADPGYSAFVASKTSRAPMVYAAVNDGMLHAFSDADGTEKFAYVPRALFRTSEQGGLAALTLKEAALPPFQHHFYVDSTPKVVDVDFGSQDWHSILVGGLGKGGHAYYALDVTDPASIVTEDDAAAKVLWEFTDPDLGYTYGPPIIAKTRAFGGKWVVIVPSGYNNTSGIGKIWFLDAKTGAVLKTMSTDFGSTGSPSGLAQIASFTQDYHNYLADEVYGGDQYGNLWRFDIRDTDPSKWTVGLLAKLTDPDGNPQPVTTAPQIEVDIANGADRWVFVGTGRLLDESDLSDDQIQTFYALRDGTQKTPGAVSGDLTTPAIKRSDLVAVTDATGTGGITAHGWYDDLAEHSRIVSPYQAALSIVVYAATKPQTDPCLTGQSADIFVRNFAAGVSQIDPSQFTGTGSDACNAEYCTSEGGAVDAQIIGVTADGTTTANLAVEITLGSTGKLLKIPIKQPAYDYSHRLSWRILSE